MLGYVDVSSLFVFDGARAVPSSSNNHLLQKSVALAICLSCYCNLPAVHPSSSYGSVRQQDASNHRAVRTNLRVHKLNVVSGTCLRAVSCIGWNRTCIHTVRLKAGVVLAFASIHGGCQQIVATVCLCLLFSFFTQRSARGEKPLISHVADASFRLVTALMKVFGRNYAHMKGTQQKQVTINWQPGAPEVNALTEQGGSEATSNNYTPADQLGAAVEAIIRRAMLLPRGFRSAVE
jgi:hypothetical protein